MSDLVHDTYRPFTRDHLRAHFTTVKSTAALEAAHMADSDLARKYRNRHLRYPSYYTCRVG